MNHYQSYCFSQEGTRASFAILRSPGPRTDCQAGIFPSHQDRRTHLGERPFPPAAPSRGLASPRPFPCSTRTYGRASLRRARALRAVRTPGAGPERRGAVPSRSLGTGPAGTYCTESQRPGARCSPGSGRVLPAPWVPSRASRHGGFLCCGEAVHLRVLAEELMQKTRHHREVGHLGCVIRDTLEKSKGGGKEGEEEEEKTEF